MFPPRNISNYHRLPASKQEVTIAWATLDITAESPQRQRKHENTTHKRSRQEAQTEIKRKWNGDFLRKIGKDIG